MIYRTEHPKPQFERATWQNLNGKWQFEIDHGNSGEARGLHGETALLQGEINVPFCPESRLSGVQYTDFMRSVWYKREFTLTKAQTGGRVLLHFGAVDYVATVYVNGEKCGVHKGGYVSFSTEITKYVREGVNVLTVHAEDNTRDMRIPSGKQSPWYASSGCHYTRTTGIWQTVWLEFVPTEYIKKAKYYPDVDGCALTVIAELCGKGELTARAFFEGREMGEERLKSDGGIVTFTLPLKEKHLWQVGEGNLYDLQFAYGRDEVKSYFGLRKIRIEGHKMLINGRSVFQRLVLDQGFYPDGIYTAPSDEELEADVDRSMAMGFNGARLHEKVFEERFLYHCDRKGYIVWGEFPNWGLDLSYAESIYGVLPEWTEEVERDFNHPSIVGWCPFNESWSYDGRKQCDDVLRLVYDTTKLLDPTRPMIDSSGGKHIDHTDVVDTHNYTQEPESFAKLFERLETENTFFDYFENRELSTGGKPMFVSEYGGIAWAENPTGWGYGAAPLSEEEFLTRLEGLTDVLLKNPLMFGYCYTQLTDVEQEQNGLYTYDRKAKFPPERIRPIFSKKAAIEKE